MFTITQICVTAGHTVCNNATMDKLHTRLLELNGRATNFTDKTVDLEFDTAYAMQQFKAYAESLGAMFD